MIDAITLETAHLLGDALPSLHRLRYRIFVERQKYEVPTHRSMEWDQFDTPAAVYLLWRDDLGQARAVARLIPTTFPYMIKELWPELMESGDLPSRDDIWEVTRLGVDRDLEPANRKRVLGELLCGCGEYGLRHGVKAFLFVTHPHIIKNIMVQSGCPTEVIGEPRRLGRYSVAAARTSVTHEALAKLQRHHGILHPVLRIAGDARTDAA